MEQIPIKIISFALLLLYMIGCSKLYSSTVRKEHYIQYIYSSVLAELLLLSCLAIFPM